VISAISGAVGALKGPLHGGAPGPALDMVFEIGTPERAEPVIRAMLDRGERLMGFGHRVYRVRDPRADVLARAAERFYAGDADRSVYELARQVEATALRLLRERKPDRRLDTNVEFYTAAAARPWDCPPNYSRRPSRSDASSTCRRQALGPTSLEANETRSVTQRGLRRLRVILPTDGGAAHSEGFLRKIIAPRRILQRVADQCAHLSCATAPWWSTRILSNRRAHCRAPIAIRIERHSRSRRRTDIPCRDPSEQAARA
jgi:hypothetical protein